MTKLKVDLAGAVGVEPTTEVLETSVLPLNYTPVLEKDTLVFEGGDYMHYVCMCVCAYP